MRALWLLGLLSLGSTALADDFVVQPGGENRVVFTSRATIETFEGKTTRLSGRLSVDPAHLGDSVFVHLEVDLASLSTGIAKRDEHMRDAHLETKRYPTAVFDGASLVDSAQAGLAEGKPVSFEAAGTFSLHGVSRRIRIPVTALRTRKGGLARISFDTTFPVALNDYAISRPQFLFLKLADAQEVRVHGVAVAGK